MAAIRFSGALSALLLLASCDAAPEAKERTDPALFVPAPSCSARTFEGTEFTICTFDSRTETLELAWRGADGRPLRSLSALDASLGARSAEVKFAMNAGMYDDQGAPIGLFVENGVERRKLNRKSGSGNFHLMPNGVFSVDAEGRVSVTSSSRFAQEVPSPRWATQSGPMLVVDGKLHPKFSADGESRFIRNGVGVKDGSTAYFVISEDAVSFGRFARFFRDALGRENALYLDGTVSSLWDPSGQRQDGYSELGPMAVVFRKAR